jgi:TP901 family phage tail tape measure protein
MAKSNTTNRRVNLYINGKEAATNIKEVRAEMQKLVNEQARMKIGSDEYIAHAKKIRGLKSILDEHKRQQQDVHKNWLSLSNMTDKFNKYFGMVATGVASITGIMMGFRRLSEDVAKMDDIYADVEKTTNLTKKEVKELNEEFKKMDTRTSREELNRLAADAGKLGITGKKDLLDFVDAGNQINVALGEDLGEGAIKNIGKITQVYKSSTKELESLDLKGQMLSVGSAINELGQSSTASEAYLVDFAQRLGGVVAQSGISIQNILGYASALDQSGQKVEMSATALQNFIMKLMADPAKFAQLAGQNVKEFTRLLQTDTNAAILTVLDALNNKGGFQALIPIFDEMGLDGARAVSVLSALATNINTVKEAQEVSNRGFSEATSITNEYSKKNDNLQAQLEKARKEFKEQALILGEKLNPMLLKSTNGFTYLVKALTKAPEFLRENKTLVTALVSSLSAYIAFSANAAIQTGLLSAKTSILNGIKQTYLTLSGQTLVAKAREQAATQAEIQTLTTLLSAEQKSQLQKQNLNTSSKEYIQTVGDMINANTKAAVDRENQLQKQIVLIKDFQKKRVDEMKTSAALIAQRQRELLVTKQSGDATAIRTAQLNLERAITEHNTRAATVRMASQKISKRETELETIQLRLNNTEKTIAIAKENALAASKAVTIGVTTRLRLAMQALWTSMKTNPIGWIITLVGFAVTAFSMFKKETTETTNEVARLNSEVDKEVKSVDKIVNKIKLTTSGTNDRKKAVGELNTILEKYNIELLKESDGLETLQTKYDLLNKAIKENVAERLKQEGVDRIAKEQAEELQEALQTLEKALIGRTFKRFGRKDMDEMGATLSEGMRQITIESVGMMQNIATDLLSSGASPESAYVEFYKRITDFILKEAGITYENLSTSQKTIVDRLLKNDLDVILSRYFATIDMSIAKYNASISNLDQQFKNLVPPKTTPENTGIAELIKEISLMTDKQRLQELINHEDSTVQAAAQARLAILNKETSQTVDLIKLKEKELEEAQRMPGRTKEEIAARNMKIAAIEKEIENLKKLGIVEDTTEKEKKKQLQAAETLAKKIQEINNRVQISPLKEDEKEIMAAHNKFQELLSTCQKYNLDATELYEVHHQEVSAIIDNQLEKSVTATIEAEERIQAALGSSSEKQKNEIRKRYSDLLTLAQQHGIDTDAIRQQIQEKMDRELNGVQDPGGIQLFNISEEEWEEFEEKMNMALDLAGQLNNIWGQFNELQNNRDKKELQDYEKNTNKKKELLNKQLDSGRISQERYNARVAQLDADLDKKKTEIANRQAKRDKAQGIFSATINTASSIMQALANVAPPYSYVLAAISAAMGAVQIATIASTPLPEYAQGGMTDGARVYIAGEAGREWIAPNNMLNDPITGPIIQQLELVRSGILSPEQLRPVLPDFSTMTSIPMYTTGGFTGPVHNTTNYYQTSTEDTRLLEMVQGLRDEIRIMNTYLSDPRNRQAYISNDVLIQNEKEMNLLNYLRQL